jgi:hypothetical protein
LFIFGYENLRLCNSCIVVDDIKGEHLCPYCLSNERINLLCEVAHCFSCLPTLTEKRISQNICSCDGEVIVLVLDFFPISGPGVKTKNAL